jgi:predicted nuclease of predicted toxin-antitoxin system
MRFIVDECTGPAVSAWLCENGHEVFSIYENARGMEDDKIIKKAYKESWIIITNDKDFGKEVFKDGKPHSGIILLRLEDERPVNKIRILSRLLKEYSDRISGSFIVVTENSVRAVHG